jgi:RNA polymerase sigma-70 factor (ECF subfamily)
LKVIDINQEENELILMAIENNRSAQKKIYSKFSPKMLSVCRKYIKDLQHAEDLMITAFMKVFINLKHFESKGSFEGWIRRIMINECISFLRTQKNISFLEDTYYTDDNIIIDDNDFSVEEIQQLIDNLPNGCKMIFNLYAIDGYKHSEIAELLGIKEGTSKSQLSVARRILQEQLTKIKKYNHEVR